MFEAMAIIVREDDLYGRTGVFGVGGSSGLGQHVFRSARLLHICDYIADEFDAKC